MRTKLLEGRDYGPVSRNKKILAAHTRYEKSVYGIGQWYPLHVPFCILRKDLLAVSQWPNMILPCHSVRSRRVELNVLKYFPNLCTYHSQPNHFSQFS